MTTRGRHRPCRKTHPGYGRNWKSSSAVLAVESNRGAGSGVSSGLTFTVLLRAESLSDIDQFMDEIKSLAQQRRGTVVLPCSLRCCFGIGSPRCPVRDRKRCSHRGATIASSGCRHTQRQNHPRTTNGPRPARGRRTPGATHCRHHRRRTQRDGADGNFFANDPLDELARVADISATKHPASDSRRRLATPCHPPGYRKLMTMGLGRSVIDDRESGGPASTCTGIRRMGVPPEIYGASAKFVLAAEGRIRATADIERP